MKTLFFICAAALAASALSWFFTWAIWIHAPQGWSGRQSGPLAAAHRADDPCARPVRQLTWYRRLRLLTVALLGLTLALFAGWHWSDGK